ncbi:MAG: hypothetical protein ACP5XB_20060 [Isosphaeraceae bacterium]
MAELIGWASALVIIPTFGLQVYRQWERRNQQATALTIWFFVLALVGASGQIIYSWMLENWVYLFINICLVLTDTIGLGLALHGCWVDRPGGSECDDNRPASSRAHC